MIIIQVNDIKIDPVSVAASFPIFSFGHYVSFITSFGGRKYKENMDLKGLTCF